MKVIAFQHFEVFFIGSRTVRYLREMPLKLRKNCKDQFDCILNSWKSVTWVTRCYNNFTCKGCWWIKTAYIIQFLSRTQTLKFEELPH